MGVFDFLKGKNDNKHNLENSYSYVPTSIDSFFGASTMISEDEAMQIPSVSAAVDLITGSIAQLDFMLIKKDDETGEVIRKNEDYRLYLLNREPNETMDAYTFKRAMVKDYLLYGASSSVIERNLNKINALHLLPTQQISVEVYLSDGYKKYSKTKLNNSLGTVVFDDYRLLTVLKDSKDGLTGMGVLQKNYDILKLARAENNYTANILQNGALPIGVLKTANKLNDKSFAKLKSSWSNLYSGSDKAGKTVILEEGLDYSPISMKPNDLELTESKKSTLSNISRIFNIPESMINSNANKYGSNEQNNLNFLQYCISPIISAIEGAVNKQLLLESEKEEGFEFKLDPSKLLQTTRKDKAEAVGIEYNNGLISFWEARSEIDRPKTVEKDYFKMSLGSVLHKYESDEMIIPNTMQSKAALKMQEEAKGG